MKPENKKLLTEGARANGFSLNSRQLKQFTDYLEVLDLWARKMNLTAIRDERNRVALLLIDSLAAAAAVKARAEEDPARTLRVMDLGSGAGVPGIPVKIALPAVEMTLCEARQKRVLFLKEAIRKLGLSGIWVHHGRAEELTPEAGPGTGPFEVVMSRAVGPLSELAGLCREITAERGLIIAMKGPDPEPELEESRDLIDRAGFRLEAVKRYELYKLGVLRSLVMMRKKSLD